MNTPPLTVLSVPHDALNFAMPAEACDCHTHVFGPSANYPLSPERNYMPGDALVPDLLALHDGLHIARVVIVHPSPYGSDNACTAHGGHRCIATAPCTTGDAIGK